MGLVANIADFVAICRDYRSEGRRVLHEHPGSIARRDLLRFFPRWFLSLDPARDPLRDRRPWITFPALRYLDRLLGRESKVFEFGAGGSTLYFATRVGLLATVEHDRAWLDRTTGQMRACRVVSWHPELAEPAPAETHAPSDPLSYASTDPRFSGFSFRRYAQTIEKYEDNFFDLILIDGRARPACFMHAVAKVKFGGHIVLDNAERPQYAYVEDAARRLGFELREFWGPGPYNRYFWRTLFLRKVGPYYALNDLDVKLERHLDFDGGTFVEAGANDGVAQSNTLYFEANRGWRGLLIEPIPHLADECRRCRPHAIVEQAALVAADREPGPVVLRYANLMSTIKGGMRTAEEEDAHIASGLAVQKIGTTYEMSVPAATLSGLLDKHGIRHVDLLSLDVEGYELGALKGLDLSRHRPRFILVEARYRDEVHAHLSSHYELVEELSFHDLLYRLRGDAAAARG